MLLYSEKITNRLKYIIDFVSKELALEITLATDKAHFDKESGPKINYSTAKLSPVEFWVEPSGLLFEESISPQTIICFNQDKYPAFFKTTQGDLDFDLFAASFYLISRYEEYLPHQQNTYGCYAHTNSIAFKENFLHLPLVNIWLEQLRKLLLEKWPSLKMEVRKFRFIPSYDIDTAWHYKDKGLKRTLGSLLRSTVKGEFAQANKQLSVLSRRTPDPYYAAYEWMDAIHDANDFKPIYFFLMAKKQVGFDKNIPTDRRTMRELIKRISEKSEVALHPSWQSGDSPTLLSEEKKELESITGKPVSNSRQHYIRWTLPQTFRSLIAAGIENDFSMGYSTVNGFRASVASPFYWYDLKAEVATQLKLWPFCFMDSTAIFEQKLQEEQALVELKELFKSIGNVNGLMITIWHNNYLGSDPNFQGWKRIYETFLNELASGT